MLLKLKKMSFLSRYQAKYTSYANTTHAHNYLRVTNVKGVLDLLDLDIFLASTSDKGLMSAADKVALNNAVNYSYTHPTTHPASMIEETNDIKMMTSEERTKLAGIAAGANNYTYTHPSVNHIPTGGSSGKILRWSSSGTATWGDDSNTVYTHPSTAGNKHIPSGGSSGKYLKWSSDGTATWELTDVYDWARRATGPIKHSVTTCNLNEVIFYLLPAASNSVMFTFTGFFLGLKINSKATSIIYAQNPTISNAYSVTSGSSSTNPGGTTTTTYIQTLIIIMKVG
jgi:hypothetical protein